MLIAYVAVEKTSFVYDRLYKYIVPLNFVKQIKIGSFVLVPFGNLNKIRQAVVFNLKEEQIAENLKSVIKPLSINFNIKKEMLCVAKFLHSKCFCSWYDTIKAILPAGFFYDLKAIWVLKNDDECLNLSEKAESLYVSLKKITSKKKLNELVEKLVCCEENKQVIEELIIKKKLEKINDVKRKILNKNMTMVKANEEVKGFVKLTQKQQKLLDYIKQNEEVSLKQACYVCGVTVVVAKNLLKLNLIKIFEKHVYRNPYEFAVKKEDASEIVLNKEQEEAKEGILSLLKENCAHVALLKGVTGSGKTSVFLKLIDYVIKQGKDCILLVPEISLTAQILSYFQSFFGKMVAVYHSGISSSEQHDEYVRILKGEAHLIIGTRSAIFAPCKNLGLIIMDEEEGACYKNSEMSPRYDAKDVAKFRVFKTNSLLLLASATPSIETNYFAEKGVYKKFVLKNRYFNLGLPKVFVVDLKKTRMSLIPNVSKYLYEEILLNFKNKEQTILFLNRRGYHLSVICLDCASAIKCDNCSAFMVYHSVNKTFMCHYCGAIKQNISCCNNCKSKRLVFSGQGTQKIEDYIKEKINGIKILRLDSDSIFNRLDLENKIKMFENKEYDILVGTQIVAKGLNFANVTLVGVIAIDSILFGADFKSSERAFSMLTQVIGRSGRGSKKGRAIIQTYNPSNKVILWSAKQNYDVFYENEIVERKEFFCPPFCDLCIINFSGFDEKRLYICAEKFILSCKKNVDVKIPFIILGISAPYLEKLNKRYRKRVIIKCKNSFSFRNWIKNIAKNVFSMREFVGVRANIDINGDIL